MACNILVAADIQLGWDRFIAVNSPDAAWNTIRETATAPDNQIDLILIAGNLFSNLVERGGSELLEPSETGIYTLTDKTVKAVNLLCSERPVDLKSSTRSRVLCTRIHSLQELQSLTVYLQSMCGPAQLGGCLVATDVGSETLPAMLFEKDDVNVAVYMVNCDESFTAADVELRPPPADKCWCSILVLHYCTENIYDSVTSKVRSSLPEWLDIVLLGGGQHCDFTRILFPELRFNCFEIGSCVTIDGTQKDQAYGVLSVKKFGDCSHRYVAFGKLKEMPPCMTACARETCEC